MEKQHIPFAPVERLMRDAGVKRLSSGAVHELRNILKDVAIKLSNQSMELAKHAGRSTLKAKDIRLARKLGCGYSTRPSIKTDTGKKGKSLWDMKEE